MFATQNTKLAAALLALDFSLAPSPFERGGGAGVVTINFTDADRLTEYERAWRSCREFERASPGHPLVYMRHAADARDWIINEVLYGGHDGMNGAELPARVYWTDDLHLAVCLVASNWYLYRLDAGRRRFYFREDARSFADTESCSWMRRYLVQYDLLKVQIKRLTRAQSECKITNT